MIRQKATAKALAAKRYAMTPLAAAVMYALNPASQALAQENESDDFGIEEIVVTATKRTVSIQDVPQSITAFSTIEIERRGILDMADIATNLPSISLSSNRAGRNELVYRGISAGGSWRLDSQVAVYLDEMPMTMSTTQLDPRMVDIERVESLPGPQGTLFGSSSQAGTLRVITNKPRIGEFSGQVSGEYKTTDGGEDSYDINGHLNIPVSDNFAIRVVGYTNKDGGYIDNVYSTSPHSVCAAGAACNVDPSVYTVGPFNPVDQQGHLNSRVPDNAGLEEDDFNDYEMTGGRISALWNVNDDWNLLATYMTQSSETTGVWFSDTAIGDYKVARFSDEWRKDDWSTIALTVQGDLGFAQITNSFGFANRDQSYQFDNTHYDAWHTRLKGQYWSAAANYGAYLAYAYYGTSIPQYNYYDKYDTDYNGGVYRSLQESERITNELRLTSTTDSRFQWMVGAFYENFKDGWVDDGLIPNLETTKHWRYTQWRSCELANQGFSGVQCPAPSVNDVWYQDSYRRDMTQIAAFGEVDFHLTDELKLTAGLRWFEHDRYTINDRQWPLHMPVEAIVLDGEAASIEEGKESDTFAKFGFSWTLNEDQMVYALYSQGFRLGGHNNPKAVRVNFVDKTYDPDKLNNYEAGIKSEWLNNRLQINASLFYLTWDDIQLSVRSGQSGLWWLRGQANGGGGRNLGAELDFDWRATENFRISGNFYKGDAYYTDDYLSKEGVLQMSAGTSMPDSANEKYSIAFDYTFRDVMGGDIWLRYDAYYVGPMYSALWKADEANPDSPDYVTGNTHDVDSFTKSNFQIGYERESWAATLFVRNLTNERANTYTNSGGAAYYGEWWGHTGFGETHNLARPRTISAKFTYRF
ncbi:MAG: TonB-dependent receptor [Woeseiaceae bacterium]|nr:TonB-dependent receptor [Woeseiaceae bacterium]